MRLRVPGFIVIAATLAVWSGQASAQHISPKPPPANAPLPGGLFDCTAEAANVSAFVDSAGSISIYNVPSNQGQVRVRTTCRDIDGNTVTGVADPVTPIPGGITHFGKLDFGAYVPIAASLNITPPTMHLVGLGSTQQLVVGAAFADQTNGDVTNGSSGTTYKSSNPSVATVSADGLVTAIGAGTSIIYAVNEGAAGLATVSVLPAALASLTSNPSSLNFGLSPVFQTLPAQLHITATLTDFTTVDWTQAKSGVTYQSSDPTVAVVGIDGAVLGVSPGVATITAIDGPSGVSTDVPVVVTTSSPEPTNACWTPGYAYNVDVDGIWAFVACGSGGLQIISTNDCSTGGQLPLNGQNVVDVKVRGQLAALALGSGGLALVDVSSVATPHVLSTTTSIGDVQEVWISGDLVYAVSSNGLFVYDVTNPATPALVGTQTFGGQLKAVAADSTRGLVVVLTSSPSLEVVQMGGTAPWPVVSVPLPANTNHGDDVTLFGTSAYVANGKGGIVRVNVLDSANPYIDASSTLDFDALGVAVQQTPKGVFVAAADDNFVNAVPLFDANLNNTFNIDFSSFPGTVQSDANSNGIALGDGFGVVTTGSSGIQIFRSKPLVDNNGVAPTVALLTPAQNADVPAGLFTFVKATAADDVAVTSVKFLLDGQVQGTLTTPPYQFLFTAGSAGTTHTIQLQATDPGGNVGFSMPVTVNAVQLPPQATGFTVLGGSPINYGGIDYTVLQVAFNSADSVGATWCDDYKNLCQVYGLAPTGCGDPYASGSDGYGVCASQYGSVGASDNLGCEPTGSVVAAAQQAGFSDAQYDNSFAFAYCDDTWSCQKTMCSGSYCNSALSYIDLTKPYGYTLCAAPPTCFDGHKNQGEAGVDCGGPCAQNCCSDGIKNDEETGLDCGGPTCAACTNLCNDGIKDSDETYVDCGGTFCGVCPTGFGVLASVPVNYNGTNYTLVKVQFNSDIASGPTWCDDYLTLCQGFGLAPTGCGLPYATMNNGYGACSSQYGSMGEDGNLSCNPSWSIAEAAQQAGFFDATDTNSFGFHYCDENWSCQKQMCSGPYCNSALSYIDISQPFGYTLCASPPSCTDGKKNQGEIGVDCGGPCANDCCSNGVKEPGETGIDCGGPVCPACTDKCGDGIKNSDEMSVDCGGTFCAACPFVTKWSEGTEAWPDQACNPTFSFGGCNTNDQAHADAWATWVCQHNGYSTGFWTGNKQAGCTGEISMYCGGNIPCTPFYEFQCAPGDQTKIELTCLP